MSYVNLHAHTSFSDGLGDTLSLVQAADDYGQPAYAITDHGTISGWVEFQRACEEVGIMPIFGVEMYIRFNDRGTWRTGHMTWLAKNNKGLDNIKSLVTYGHQTHYRYNAVSLVDMVRHAEGTILLSGCPNSPLYAWMSDVNEVNTAIHMLHGAWGDDFYLEVMPHGHDPDYTEAASFLMDNYSDIPIVGTNDIHYARENLQDTHMFVHQMIRHYSYDNQNLHNRDTTEFTNGLHDAYFGYDVEGAVDRTLEIADKVNHGNASLHGVVKLPEGDHSAMMDKIIQRLQEINLYDDMQAYVDRLAYEWEIVKSKGYLDYFYIVWQSAEFAKSRDIRTGSRGSAAGCLILYLLGVHEIDPIRYGLLFERFLSLDRTDYPDVDIDFEHERREEVLKFARDKWDARPVSTRIRYGHSSLVRDIARMTNAPKKLADEASVNPDSDAFYELVKDDLTWSVYITAEDQVRNVGKHAGGIVISSNDYPLERLADGTLAVPWGTGVRSDDLTPVGLVKFDYLGSKALTALKMMEDIAGVKPAPFGEDPLVFELFAKGNLKGIFQMSKDKAIQLAVDIEPETGEEIAAILALNRPGPLNSGMADEYPMLKDSPRKIHPIVDEILAETRGVMVYQEQIMKIFQAVAGASPAETNTLRKIVGKKKVDDPMWKVLEAQFLQGCTDGLGMTKDAAYDFWNEIQTFSEYGFNKSHAYAYAQTTWNTAWYKVHHPLAFFTAMLEHSSEDATALMYEAVRHGAVILPPHVNYSSFKYETDGDNIYMPFTTVKGIGDIAASTIVATREAGGEFASMQDFMTRNNLRKVHKGIRTSLVALGAFEGVPGGAISDLQVTPQTFLDWQDMGAYKTQKQLLQIIVPTKEIIDELIKINGSLPKNSEVGMVDDLYHGENDRGMFTVLTLLPSKERYFFRSQIELVEGEVVQVTTATYGNVQIKKLM